MLKYFKNFVLCGEVDYFCLLCKESFEQTDQVEKHIRWEQHRKLIKVQEYLPKFKKEQVFKLGDKYYCEVCNYVTSALDTIKNHVKQDNHKANKANPGSTKRECLVRRELGFVIVYKNALNKKEWHGVINKHCVICDKPVENFTTHSASPDHIMGLIQSQVIKENEDIIRKINEDKSYCFKCKVTIEGESVSDHLNSKAHVGNDNKDKVKVLFEINKENLTATCVLCDETMLWSGLQLDDHRTKHIKKGEWIYDEKEAELTFMQLHYQDKGKLRSDLKKYGRGNFIKLNEGGSKGYCSQCNAYISAHMRNFKQHVEGTRHSKFLELKGLKDKTDENETEKIEYSTKPFKDIYTELIYVKNSSIFLVPSAELCIGLMSLTYVTQIDNNKVACYVCEGSYKDWRAHITKEHCNKMFNTKVVTSLKGEFIRELSPGLFHCGVCNKSYASWMVLEAHLKLFSHKYARAEAHRLIENIIDPSMLGESNSLIPELFTNYL